jgi:hypothetical protein
LQKFLYLLRSTRRIIKNKQNYKTKGFGNCRLFNKFAITKNLDQEKKSEQESFPKLATPITEILHGPIKQKAQARDIVPVELLQFLTDFVRRKDQY